MGIRMGIEQKFEILNNRYVKHPTLYDIYLIKRRYNFEKRHSLYILFELSRLS